VINGATARAMSETGEQSNKGNQAMVGLDSLLGAETGLTDEQLSQDAVASTQEPPAALRLPRVALCSRVDGFGRYRPMASNVFVAGRPLRAIVYAEVDGFRARPARSGDALLANVGASEQQTVELSQALRLYTDVDGTLVWQRGAQRALETSLSPRRDFYLLQVIELPATLGVGRYNLKVVVVDATTSQQAEAVLPIVLVAEPQSTRQ
jgi:hypothetical protein